MMRDFSEKAFCSKPLPGSTPRLACLPSVLFQLIAENWDLEWLPFTHARQSRHACVFCSMCRALVRRQLSKACNILDAYYEVGWQKILVFFIIGLLFTIALWMEWYGNIPSLIEWMNELNEWKLNEKWTNTLKLWHLVSLPVHPTDANHFYLKRKLYVTVSTQTLCFDPVGERCHVDTILADP